MTGKKADGGKEAEQNQEPTVVPGTETAPAPSDAADYASLWLDPGLGDGITNTSYITSPPANREIFSAPCPTLLTGGGRKSIRTNRRVRSTKYIISLRRRCAVSLMKPNLARW